MVIYNIVIQCIFFMNIIELGLTNDAESTTENDILSLANTTIDSYNRNITNKTLDDLNILNNTINNLNYNKKYGLQENETLEDIKDELNFENTTTVRNCTTRSLISGCSNTSQAASLKNKTQSNSETVSTQTLEDANDLILQNESRVLINNSKNNSLGNNVFQDTNQNDNLNNISLVSTENNANETINGSFIQKPVYKRISLSNETENLRDMSKNGCLSDGNQEFDMNNKTLLNSSFQNDSQLVDLLKKNNCSVKVKNTNSKRNDISLSVEQKSSSPSSKNSVGISYNFGSKNKNNDLIASAGNSFGNSYNLNESTSLRNSVVSNSTYDIKPKNETIKLDTPEVRNVTKLLNSTVDTPSSYSNSSEPSNILNQFFQKGSVSNSNEDNIPRGNWTSLKLCNATEESNCRGRDKVENETLNHKNHSAISSFDDHLTLLKLCNATADSNCRGRDRVANEYDSKNHTATTPFESDLTSLKLCNTTTNSNCRFQEKVANETLLDHKNHTAIATFKGNLTSLELCNDKTDSNCKGRDKVANETLDHKNHTAITSFEGEITKIETGTKGNSNVNGSTQFAKINETDDFYQNRSTFKFTNLTEFQNCSGCLMDKNKEDNGKVGNIKLNNNTTPTKRCNLGTIDSSTFKNRMSMEDNYDDYDVSESMIRCVKAKIKMFQAMNTTRRNKIAKRLEAFRRRLISNHLTTRKNSTNTNVTNPTKQNEKVNEKLEKQKNEERVQSNEERAKDNQLRLQENEKIKYKILNGIHDQPESEQPIPEERGVTNLTIPIDPSMMPEKIAEPLTQDNKDALVGILGIDTSPAIENGTNITAHLIPNNKNVIPEKIEKFDDVKKDGEGDKKLEKSDQKLDKPDQKSEQGINQAVLNQNTKENLINKDKLNETQESHKNQSELKKPDGKSDKVEQKIEDVINKDGQKVNKNITIINQNKSNETKTKNPKEVTESMKKRILCFGDSLTKGYYAKGTENHPYSRKLRELLEEHDKNTEYEIITEGVNGDCVFKGMKDRLPKLINETFPLDLVIILGGTNDLLTQDCAKDIDLYQEIKELHEICHRRGIKTGVVTIPQLFIDKTSKMNRNEFNEVWGTVNQKLRVWAYAAKHPKMVILIDLADEFTRQNTKNDFSEYWDDDIHPSVKGYDRIGQIVFDDIMGKF